MEATTPVRGVTLAADLDLEAGLGHAANQGHKVDQDRAVDHLLVLAAVLHRVGLQDRVRLLDLVGLRGRAVVRRQHGDRADLETKRKDLRREQGLEMKPQEAVMKLNEPRPTDC